MKFKLEPKSGTGNTTHSFQQSIAKSFSLTSSHPSACAARKHCSKHAPARTWTDRHAQLKSYHRPMYRDFFLLTSWHVLHENKRRNNLRAKMTAETSQIPATAALAVGQINPWEHHLCKHTMFTSTKDRDKAKDAGTKSRHFSEASW